MISLPDYLASAPVGREKLPRDVMEKHQQGRVLEAAISIFARHGYASTTIDDLVAGAKMSVGSFYAHFDGKEACLLAAFDQVAGEASSAVRSATDGQAEWSDRLCVGLRALLEWVAQHPERARIALIEIQTAGQPARLRFDRTLETAADAMRAGRAGVESTHELPERLEQTLVAGMAWVLNENLATLDVAALPSLYPDLAELLLEPYVGKERVKELIAAHPAAPAVA